MRRVLLPLALAASVSATGGWGTLCSFNPLSSFTSPAPKVAALAPVESSAELKTLWQVNVGPAGDHVFQPAVVGDDIYAAAHAGAVARYRDGKAVWSVNAGARLSAGVGSDGKLAVVVTTDGEVVALDAENGAERWRSATGAEVLVPPAVGDGHVVVRASDSRLVGFDAKTGARRWVFQRPVPPLALRTSAGVIVEGGAAVAGYPGGKLVAVNLANGGQIWELTVASPRGSTELERVADVVGTPVFGRREICAVAFQGRVACFDFTNGNALWSREFSSGVGMARDARFVYVTDDADAVHGLDAFSGGSVWKQDSLSRRAVSRPVVAGDFVAVGDIEGYVHLLRRESGVFAARVRTGGSPIVADPKPFGAQGFVVQARDGGLYVFEAR